MTTRILVSFLWGVLALNSVCSMASVPSQEGKVQITRLQPSPIIFPGLDASLSKNIQGPSLIRVPEWVKNPLGNYYLYFADHKGDYIYLAYADQLTGPWKIYTPGTLQLSQTRFPQEPQPLSTLQLLYFKAKAMWMGIDIDTLPHDIIKELTTPHIASPDVHVDNKNKRIVMYFHGLQGPGRQVTRVATSTDGLAFTPHSENLAKSYLRVFEHDGKTHAIAMPGQFYRSIDGMRNFEEGPLLFNKNMRHAGLLKRGNTLFVFWTQVGHAPEKILLSKIDISKPWMQWTASEPVEVLRPEFDWEGADAPQLPSVRSVAYGHVNQVRDPFIFEESGKVYLLYAVAGESGIAIAEIDPATLY